MQVGEVLTLTRDFPVGTYVVQTAQPLGRLIAHMLEPETDDNVIYWNTMDAWVPRPEGRMAAALAPGDRDADADADADAPAGPPLVPIYKIMRPSPLTSSVIE